MRRHQVAGGFKGGAGAVTTAPGRAVVGLACAVFVAASVAACDPVTSTKAAAPASAAAAVSSARASADHGCSTALGAVGTYGPQIVKDALDGKQALDRAKIDVIVLVLKGAADATGNSAAKQSIVNLVGNYLKLKDSLHGKVDAAIEQQIDANTSRLRAECHS